VRERERESERERVHRERESERVYTRTDKQTHRLTARTRTYRRPPERELRSGTTSSGASSGNVLRVVLEVRASVIVGEAPGPLVLARHEELSGIVGVDGCLVALLQCVVLEARGAPGWRFHVQHSRIGCAWPPHRLRTRVHGVGSAAC
jgi:hypothetical protein